MGPIMSHSPPNSDRLAAASRTAMELLQQGKAAEAQTVLRTALQGGGAGAMTWVLLGKAQQMANDYAGMADSAASARALQPDDQRVIDFELEALILKGDLAQARRRIATLADGLSSDEAISAERLGALAERAVQIADYPLAHDLLNTALSQAPQDAGLLFNRAAVRVALGQIEDGGKDLDAVLVKRPDDGDAWYNRITLDRQAPSSPIWMKLDQLTPNLTGQPGEIPVRFARAKAFEDFGQHGASWAELERANHLRRARMRYDVGADIATMEQIAQTFTAPGSSTSPDRKPELAGGGRAPVFVVGMPRSGTTLVDRLFASHRAMASVGEVNDLALAIMEETGAVASKAQLVERSARTNPAAIGANFMRRMGQRVGGEMRPVDKTPLNFLYLGLVAHAMPEACIIHVERDPRDIAFAVYKTLFQMGYPFAYSLADITRYMIAKHALMQHWFELMPDRIVRVRYEDLVRDFDGESRRLITAAGLEWDPKVLDFHLEGSPSATASAVQVRQPVHTRSIGAWERHSAKLARVTDEFAKAGML